MGEQREVVERALAGDPTAFTQLVQQHQEWVLRWAAALLGDYQLAQDVVQEAFAVAHARLPTLAEPDAFPGWLKSIVRHTCFRVLRQHHPNLVPLDLAIDVPSGEPGPAWFAEDDERRREVLSALATLPEDQRQMVLLHYWREYSHREIASLLGVPVTTVNNRLHSARAKLRQEMLIMADKTKPMTARPHEDEGATRSGTFGSVIAIYGPVADIRFEPRNLPPLRTWLALADNTGPGKPLFAVVGYLGDGVARVVATDSGIPPRKGLAVVDAGDTVAAPIDARNAREAVAQVARLAHQQPRAATRIESGIKAIDLFCPLCDGDVVGFAARPGVGQMVLIQELLHRRGTRPGRLTLVAAIPVSDSAYAASDTYGIGNVQTIFLPLRDMASPPAGLLEPVDATVALSLSLAQLGMWPAIDWSRSSSRHLEPAVVGAEHVAVAARVRGLFNRFPPEREVSGEQETGSTQDQALVARSRRLRRFLTQPLYVAGPWIRWSAAFVPVADTIRSCRAILDGEYDSLPEEAFYMANTIEQVLERAGTS